MFPRSNRLFISFDSITRAGSVSPRKLVVKQDGFFDPIKVKVWDISGRISSPMARRGH